MDGLKLLTLGVGNAFSALYYSTCLAVEAEGVWLLIDCPHPIRKMLREASLSAGVNVGAEQVRAVVLTHLHADHCSGMEGFAFFLRYAAGQKATVLAHSAVSAELWRGHLAASMEWSVQGRGEPPVQRSLQDFIDLVSLDETNETRIGPFSIRCRRTVHSIPTTALQIRGGGRYLGYSADTAFDAGLIDWLSDADLIVHETGVGGLHTPYENLLALPASLRSRMRLIHYPDNFDLQGSAIEPLQQGRCYAV